MKLTSMKLSAEQQKDKYPVESVASPRPAYPWGLTLHLDNDTLTTLGMKSLPDAGDVLMLAARVSVTSVESREATDGPDGAREKMRSISVQITDMALAPEDAAGAADAVLYDGKG